MIEKETKKDVVVTVRVPEELHTAVKAKLPGGAKSFQKLLKGWLQEFEAGKKAPPPAESKEINLDNMKFHQMLDRAMTSTNKGLLNVTLDALESCARDAMESARSLRKPPR